MKKQMTHEEHVTLAEALRPVHQTLRNSLIEVSAKMGKSSVVTKKMFSALRALDEAKSALDAKYSSVTTDAQLKERGFVYYAHSGDEVAKAL